MSTAALLTAEEFAQLNTAETEDYELVEGELVPLPSGTPLHAHIRSRAERLIGNCLDRNRFGVAWGEIDCRRGAETVRHPDVAVFLGPRVKEIDPLKIPVPIAPDIAVEILSPSESPISVNRKVLSYIRAGTKEVWLIDHANGEVFIRTNAGMRILSAGDSVESPLLPGFSATVADLLAGY